ncbi:MAG: putative membrane protein [Cenarchaeum symbiont of Oopsacas minuta]|nr:putative membrane protein [Cenarchaeum symbiont of Oopsacas minuta]
MASKKGIIMTAVILGAITATSFLIWILPSGSTIAISDYGAYLDRVQQINSGVTDVVDNNFQMLISGTLDADEYIDSAKASSTQLRSEMIQIMQVGIPEQWGESYQKQIDLIMRSVEYIRETIAAAERINKGENADDAIEAAYMVREHVDEMALEIDSMRPDA